MRRKVFQEVIFHNRLLHESLGPEVLFMELQLDLLPEVHTLARHALLLGQGHGGRPVARVRLLVIMMIVIIMS